MKSREKDSYAVHLSSSSIYHSIFIIQSPLLHAHQLNHILHIIYFGLTTTEKKKGTLKSKVDVGKNKGKKILKWRVVIDLSCKHVQWIKKKTRKGIYIYVDL